MSTPTQAIPAITSTFGYPILLLPLLFIVLIDMAFTIIEVRAWVQCSVLV